MQTLYTLSAMDETSLEEQKEAGSKLLNEKLANSLDLFIVSILYTFRVAQYAEKDAGDRAAKYLPTEADLNVSTKIAANDFLMKVLSNETFAERIKETAIKELIDEDRVKKIYKQFAASEKYQEYVATKDRDKKTEVAIIKHIWEDYIWSSEEVMEFFSEELPNWDDDDDMMKMLMDNFFKNPSKINFLKLLSDEKNEYAHSLLHTVMEKEPYCTELIQPKLKNWDAERVALIDMLLLRMGVCELLYFPTIPTKVTINEYIEVAKYYSTPQSGQFVNGVLDNILKDLTKADKIHKEQRSR